MKKTLTLIALLISLCCNAQTIETKSSCDSNADGQVTVADVTNTANKVIGKAAIEKQVVTAEDLNDILQNILQQLLEIRQQLEDQKKLNYALEEQLGLPHCNNGHEYVDLGLPSGLKWATMNVGATTPKDNGLYFAWGETTGYTSDTSDGRLFDWASYKWVAPGKSSRMYCTKYTYPDQQTGASWYLDGTYIGTTVNGVNYKNKTVLDPDDDAAHTTWGGSWRMPTSEELNELLTCCYWEYTQDYNNCNVAGYIVYVAKDKTDKGKQNYNKTSNKPTASYTLNDTHIFLPATGIRINGDLNGPSSFGYYWTSSLGGFGSTYACNLNISQSIATMNYYERCDGHAIRPVCP